MTDYDQAEQPADTMRRAAELMREQHGSEHVRRKFWHALADWLDMEAPNAPEIGEMVFRGGRPVHALAVTCAYLGEQSILGEPA